MSKKKNKNRMSLERSKVRDYVTMREITHGTGVGAHKNKKDHLRRQEKKAKQKGYDESSPSFYLTLFVKQTTHSPSS